MDTAVTHGTPQHPTELPKGFKPHDACERDWRHPLTGASRRLRMIRIVAHDQNSLKTLVEDLGPATGEDGVYIPCDGVVEMAHVHEMLDQAIRNRARRRVERAERLPLLHEQFRIGLLNEAEEGILRKIGASTFGPYQTTERTTN